MFLSGFQDFLHLKYDKTLECSFNAKLMLTSAPISPKRILMH